MQRLPWLFDSPEVIALGAAIDPGAIDDLTEAERAHVSRALDKRQREYATGRRLARLALAELGHPRAEILAGEDRAPIWPGGIAGTISHCDRVAVSAVTRAAHATLGVDVEHRDCLKEELWKSVFLPGELESLHAIADASDRGRLALVRFSAKEALYKAQYPRTRAYMGFSELEVELVPDPSDDARGVLRCTFQNDVGEAHREGFARGFVAQGRYALDPLEGASVVTAVLIPRARG